MCPTDPSAYFWNVAASSHRIGSPSHRIRSSAPPRTTIPNSARWRRSPRRDAPVRIAPPTLFRRAGRSRVTKVDTSVGLPGVTVASSQQPTLSYCTHALHPEEFGLVPTVDPDIALRQAAVRRARELIQAYDDLVPIERLREGFDFQGQRISFGSFQKGIHRSRLQQGPAALTLTTSFKDPYADVFDKSGPSFTYAYRAGAIDQADNRALRSAHALQTPLVYFRALAPGIYWVVAPMLVTSDDPAMRTVLLQQGLPEQDMQPGGFVSDADVRAYATREARYRLHQQRFKVDVMRAYRHRCAICALRERALVQAAHIVPDPEPEGIAAVVNGLALCAIHHLAFDRNLLGIDPEGLIHIAGRLLEEIDGPMLKTGLQGFHGAHIELPEAASRPA